MNIQQRRCPLCRDWMPASARFCGTCGQPLAPPPPAKAAPPTVAAASPDRFAWRLLAGLGVLVVLLVGGIAWQMQGDHPGFDAWYHSTHSAAGARTGVDDAPLASAAPATDPVTPAQMPFGGIGVTVLPCGHVISSWSTSDVACRYGHRYREGRNGLYYAIPY